MTSSPCAPPASRPSRPANWWRRSWGRSGCDCSPRRPGSCASREALRASTSWASITGCGSPGDTGVVGICSSGRVRERWPRSRGQIRERTDRSRARLSLEDVVADLNPVLRGWGELLPLRELRRAVLAHRRLRQRTARASRQRQARTHGPQLGHPLQLQVGQQPARPSPHRNHPTHDCVCQSVNDVGEPCAGEPHARFEAAAGGTPDQSATPRGPGRLPPTLHPGGHDFLSKSNKHDVTDRAKSVEPSGRRLRGARTRRRSRTRRRAIVSAYNVRRLCDSLRDKEHRDRRAFIAQGKSSSRVR